MSIEQILYKAHATATGGREGRAFTPEGSVDLKLTTPKELGGAGAAGSVNGVDATGVDTVAARVASAPDDHGVHGAAGPDCGGPA